MVCVLGVVIRHVVRIHSSLFRTLTLIELGLSRARSMLGHCAVPRNLLWTLRTPNVTGQSAMEAVRSPNMSSRNSLLRPAAVRHLSAVPHPRPLISPFQVDCLTNEALDLNEDSEYC